MTETFKLFRRGRVCVLLVLLALVLLLSFSWAQPCEEGACFFAGPRLTSVNSERGLLLDTLFSALLDSSLDLDVLDWNALATGEVNLASFLGALAAELSVSSAETALTTDATLVQIVDAVAVVAQADGNTALVSALDALNLEIPGLTQTIKLGDLLKLSFPQGALSDIDLNVLDLLTGAVQLYNYDNVLTTPSPVTLDGTALSTLGLAGTFDQVELYLQVVEPPIYSCGPVGTTFHTAAIRSKLNVDLVDITPDTTALESALELALPGSTVDATVTLAQMQLYAELARAEGSLSAVDALTEAITINATPGAVDLYLGEISDALFFNRTHLINPTTDVQLGTVGSLAITVDQPLALPDVNVSTGIRARGAGEGQAPFATNLAFTSPYPETQTASTSANFVNNLVTDLVTNLEVELGGSLGTLLDPLVNGTILPAVKMLTQNSLSPVLETALTGLVDPVLELLGVKLGEVDVSVLGRVTTCTDGSVTIIHDADPDDTTDFAFSATGAGVSAFTLDDDADPTLPNSASFTSLRSGNYSFEVAPVAGWMLESISCTEGGGGTLSTLSYGPKGSFFTGVRSVNVGLLADEDVTCTFLSKRDSDGDEIPDDIDPDPNDIDPQGYLYDEVTGEIIPGGSISVVDSGGSSANVNVAADGSTGEYQFFVTAADTYTVSVTPPPGYAPSSVCPAQAGAYDATPTPDPNVIGSDDDVSGTSLADASCGANPYYYSFILSEGDALVINNNYPLVPAASVSKSFSPGQVPAATESTLSITIANTGTNAVDLTNLSLTDDLPSGLEVASTPNASTTCSGGGVGASAGGSGITLSGASLNIGASCAVSVDVASSVAGSHDNLIPAANLDNDQNVNADGDAAATLTVLPTAPSDLVCSAGYELETWPASTSGGTTFASTNNLLQLTASQAFTDSTHSGDPGLQLTGASGVTSVTMTLDYVDPALGAPESFRLLVNDVDSVTLTDQDYVYITLGGSNLPAASLGTRLEARPGLTNAYQAVSQSGNGSGGNPENHAGYEVTSVTDGMTLALNAGFTGAGSESFVGFQACVPKRDYSDAPLSYGDATHTLTAGVQLGAAIDDDNGSLASADADADGADDDGVSIPTLLQGNAASISVEVAQASANDAYLQAWIDWNGDGDFADANEQIASDLQTAATSGTISVPVAVPATATTSQTFARFRWSTASGLGSAGAAPDGEVEDYALTVQAPPSGEVPISCNGTLYQIATSNSTLKRLNFAQSGGSYTASLTNIGSAGQNVNAGWGFNELDSLLYGVRSGTQKLWRIDANATFTELANFPATASNGSNAGDILPDGMMIYKQDSTTWQLLDISDPENPVDAGDLVLDTVNSPNDSISPIDFGLNPFDGYIYAVDPATDRLFYVDITGYDTVGAGNTLTVTPVLFGPATHTGAYGATWFDEDGNMFLWNNSNNTIYKADIGTDGNGSGELLEIAVSSDDEGGINDGAYCRGPAPIPLGSLDGTLYEDVDGSDTLNGGDATLGANISVSAYYDNGTPGDTADDTFFGTAQTDVNGWYEFSGVLINQTYRLEVDSADPDIPVGASVGTTNPVEGVSVTADTTTTVNFGFDIVRDYGDAPVSYGNAAHGVSPNLRLGVLTDTETATQLGGDTGVGADGDDTDGGDDEDGVSFNSALYTPASVYTIPASDISVTNTSSGAATLHAWLDFDRNGSFESDEYASATVANGTTNGNPSSGLSWSGTGVSGMSAGITYARFRLTTDTSVTASTPGGSANGGEVEDHALLIQDPPTVCDGSTINELSFQNPFLTAGTALQVNAVYRFYNVVPGLDALVTVDSFNSGAGLITIDDAVNGLPIAFQPHLDLPTTAVPDASVDFNIEFVISGSSIPYALDRIFASGVDIDGDSGNIREYIELSGYSSYALESPSNLTYVPNPNPDYDGRFEATTTTTQPGISPNATENIARAVFERVSGFNYRIGAFNAGTSSNDRLNSLFLECVSLDDTEDHGDAPTSYGDAVHEVPASATLYLGAVSPDVETEAQQGGDAGVGADGDDGDGTDDEDGVTLGGADFQNQTLTLGTSLSPDVSVVGSGFLNAWVDWNRDGDFADAGERVATDVQDSDADGTITLTLDVPATAPPGLTYARFRWSTTSSLSPTGTASDGEVEDYVLVISPQFISGTIFYDDGYSGGTPNDALQNGGELGVSNVTVTATDGSNSVSTVTDASGDYTLTLPSSFSGAVTVSHSLQPATGSSIGGVTDSSCLAASYEDVDAAAQLIGDTDCSGTINGSETGFTPDTGYNNYDFGVVRPSRFIADQSGQASSPGVIEYAHLYTPGTLGSLTVTQTSGDYTYQLFVDENCDGTYGAAEGPHTLPYILTVGSGWPRLGDGRLQECSFKVRVLVPDGEADGATDTATLSAGLAWQTNAAVTDNRFVTDTTVITEGGQLELIKEVRNVTQSTSFSTTGIGKPGEVLEYRIIYTNRGSDRITAVEFSDPVPYFTDVELNQYDGTGEVELICPDAGVINLDTDAVNIVEIDIMSECGIAQIEAGEGGTVTYRVRIR